MNFKDPRDVFETKKIFRSPQSRRDKAKNDPYFENYRFRTVPIKDLLERVSDDDLKGREQWGDDVSSYIYDSSKDNDDLGYIYATKQDNGKYQLGGGRHRLRAALNNGFTDANIPIYDEYANSKIKEQISALQESDNPDDLNLAFRLINSLNIPKEQKQDLRTLNQSLKNKLNQTLFSKKDGN